VEAKNSKHLAPAPTRHWENSQRTRKNPWFFEGCKLPGTSGSLILIFFKKPEPTCSFILICQIPGTLFFYSDISSTWNWWFFEKI
jgi:hypothetical protein